MYSIISSGGNPGGALSNAIVAGLKGKFKNRDIQKKYIALIQGTLPSETGIIKLPLARSIQNRSKRIVAQKGRLSITNYEVKYFLN